VATLNSVGLLHGLIQGSAVYARPDLAIGSVLWLVELAAVVLIFHVKPTGSPPGARCPDAAKHPVGDLAG
jgi:hypothetical protein